MAALLQTQNSRDLSQGDEKSLTLYMMTGALLFFLLALGLSATAFLLELLVVKKSAEEKPMKWANKRK